MSVSPAADPATSAWAAERPSEEAELTIIMVDEAGRREPVTWSPKRQGILARLIQIAARVWSK